MMKYAAVMLVAALLTGAAASAYAQAKSPNADAIQREQGYVAKAEAKGDLKEAAMCLRTLALLYKDDPVNRSMTYTHLAQVESQLGDQAKAAEYRSRAQASPASAQAAAIPPGSVQTVAVEPIAHAPAPAISTPQQPSGGVVSTSDKLQNIFAQTAQILAQVRQAQRALKQKGAATPPPDQAGAPQPGMTVPTSVSPQPPAAAGVVIGYDANNQPIFAPAPAAPAPAAGVVIGYDATNRPIFAPAPQ